LQAVQPQLATLLESEPMMPDSEPFGPKTAVDSGQVETTVIEPVTCLVCGCLCDDIAVVKQGENITEAGNACALGTDWLLRDRSHEPGKHAALIQGQPVEVAEAVEQAARMLMKAHAPIILGLGRSTNETVAAALELADRIGAVVEPGNNRSSAPRVLAFQRVGRVSATLGEVKNRADVGEPSPALAALLGRTSGAFHSRRASRQDRDRR